MRHTLLNISKKIDPEGFGVNQSLVDLLGLLTDVTGKVGIPFFVVGATARDMVLKFYDETPARATRDVDIGIRVPSWEKFRTLEDALVDTGEFERSGIQQRLFWHGGMPVDIIPFGELAGAQKQLRWPNEEDRIMSVLGFDEAYATALFVRVREEPVLDVNVASLPGIVITKLISWSESYPDRKRDALDINLIMSKYIDAGGLERLSSEAKDLIEAEVEIDIQLAGARLLGRDMARIVAPTTLKALREILERETSAGEESRLLRDMVGQLLLGDEEALTRAAALLREVERGLGEDIGLEA